MKTAFVCGACAVLSVAAAGTAAATTTLEPAGQTVTASNSGAVQFLAGGKTLRCNSLSGTGTIPASPGNSNTGTGGVDVSIDASTVSLNGCYLQVLPAEVTVNPDAGNWVLNANGDSGSPVGELTLPSGAITVRSGACTISVLGGTIGPLPFDNASHTATANRTGALSVNSNGATSNCPTAGDHQAVMTGSIVFPQVTINS